MLEADEITARRRLRRQLSLWRALAVLAGVAAVVTIVLAAGGLTSGVPAFSDHIARIKITGLISGDQDTLDMLDELKKTDRVRAVIMHIDSPGGTTAGSEALYETIRDLAEKKPVVSVMGTVAASGAYAAAIATDHIVARGNTITGSIGVIFQWPQVSKLLDTLGVEMNEIKSGPLKAEPGMFKPTTEEARAVNLEMVLDAYRWFTGLVAQRRKISPKDIKRLTDGRVFTGRQAKIEGLIDEIGGEQKAVDWLVKQRKVNKDLSIADWSPDKSSLDSELGLRLMQAGLSAAGLDALATEFEKILHSERVNLDGLMSVWHP